MSADDTIKLLVGGILGLGFVAGFWFIVWCSHTMIWIKSIAVSLMKIAARQ